MNACKQLLFAALFALCGMECPRALASDALIEGFHTPPLSARPLVWWHWMNGNVTQEGIRQDLEWMQRVGIGGVQNFDAAFPDTPARVEPRLVYMTPAWREAFKLTSTMVAEAGFELSIAGAPGWSESGGPWVKPEQAMKKLVWSEIRLQGGKSFKGVLPHPPTVIGPFQNIPIDRKDFFSGPPPTIPPHEVYEDIAVLAYRLPDTERGMAELNPRVTSSAGPLDGRRLWDGDFGDSVEVPFAPAGQSAWIVATFDEPQTIHAVSVGLHGYLPTPAAELQSSLDGQQFQTVIDIPAGRTPLTLAFAPISARYFRLRLFTPPTFDFPDFLHIERPTAHHVTEFVLHTSARVHRAEEKAAFAVAQALDGSETPAAPVTSAVRSSQIIDLTPRMRQDGTLQWSPPPGRWAVTRFGYSLLGITNHPASSEATGLEVDKLNRAHVLANYQQYLDQYSQFLGPDLMGKRGLKGMVNDSWEAGAQNWTEVLPQEFARRRSYSLIPWLPALTGRVIDSAERTDRFLWDFRKTLGELVADDHYGTIAEELHRRGMIHYAESHEPSRSFIGDGMAVKRFADVPMGAMWSGEGYFKPRDGDASVRESASVAHLYGKNVVAAEAFTTDSQTYAVTPEMLKPVADRLLSQGLNRFAIHTSVHQPLDEPGPGFTLGPHGQWFTRHETWAEQAKPWIEYLSRSSYLLQQGQFVADVLYFYGEDSNIAALYREGLPAMPAGFNFDFVNDEALGLLSVRDGKLVTESGMRYAVLALDPRARIMSLPVLERLRQLVTAGATLIGDKPHTTPSLADDAAAFRAASEALWGPGNESGERRVGKGRVIANASLAEAVARLGLAPDFSYKKPAPDSDLWFVHRRLIDGDLYFVNNLRSRAETVEASFRVSGKAPQLWHADTGRIEPASYRIVGERTIVPLRLDPADAVFVVFRESSRSPERVVPAPNRTTAITVAGPWEVRFSTDQGAPAVTNFEQLTSWTESAQPSIKYYSGTATYARSINVRARWMTSGAGIELDLGAVRDIAEVRVNGQSLGVLWERPFRMDITRALRPGANRLEVRITNTWVNRLIGDKQPGAKPYVYATSDPYKADSPLLASGLLGPVRLIQVHVDGAATPSDVRATPMLSPH